LPSALSTDLYQLTMMAGYLAAGVEGRSTFELFVRDLPPERGYLVAAGLEQAVEALLGLRFTADEIEYLRTVPALARAPRELFERLGTCRFTGDAWAVRDGEAVFAHQPLVRVTAPAAQAQLVETMLLATVNFQTSVASKASRVVEAAQGRTVVEFGSRRAHGTDAALHAARAACLAGCAGTSNVEAGYRFGLPLAGTMAHSWVMTFSDEVEAFRAYLDLYGEKTTLLIDTYDTVRAARSIVDAGLRPAAVRLDSGDLARLSRQVRRIFDEGGLVETRIVVSGDLDEDRVADLVAAGAPIDTFGVGTAISTSRDAPALGGVYKLVEIERGGEMAPTIKLSTDKQTWPSAKQVWRHEDEGGATGDLVTLASEQVPGARPLLRQVIRGGERILEAEPFESQRDHCRASVGALPTGVRRLHGWDEYRVEFSRALRQVADDLADAQDGVPPEAPRT
jgi:nicotinate phosphoribosyltransferase